MFWTFMTIVFFFLNFFIIDLAWLNTWAKHSIEVTAQSENDFDHLASGDYVFNMWLRALQLVQCFLFSGTGISDFPESKF